MWLKAKLHDLYAILNALNISQNEQQKIMQNTTYEYILMIENVQPFVHFMPETIQCFSTEIIITLHIQKWTP